MTTAEIRAIARNAAKHTLNERFVPDFFYEQLEPLIAEAVEWQKSNLGKSILHNFRIDQKAHYLTSELMRSEQGERYELSDENFDRVAALDEAIAMYRELGQEINDEELCEEFEFTLDELKAIRAVKQYREEQEAREVIDNWSD